MLLPSYLCRDYLMDWHRPLSCTSLYNSTPACTASGEANKHYFTQGAVVKDTLVRVHLWIFLWLHRQPLLCPAWGSSLLVLVGQLVSCLSCRKQPSHLDSFVSLAVIRPLTNPGGLGSPHWPIRGPLPYIIRCTAVANKHGPFSVNRSVCSTQSIWIFCRRKCLCCRGVLRGSCGHWISFFLALSFIAVGIHPTNCCECKLTTAAVLPEQATECSGSPLKPAGRSVFHTNNTNSFLFILGVIIIYCTTSEHFLSSQWQNMLHFFTWAAQFAQIQAAQTWEQTAG